MKAASVVVFLIILIPVIIGIISRKTLQIPLWISILELVVFSLLLVLWWRAHHNETFWGYQRRRGKFFQ